MANIRERLTEFAKTQGFRTLSGFEKACGFTKNTLTKGHDGMSTATLCRIVDNYPQLSMDWVILGKGDMLKGNRPMPQTDTHTLPLIPIEAFAGPGMPTYEDERVEDYYTVTDFKQSDFLIRVKGDSMTPKFTGGDLVACKRIPMDQIYFVQWNRVYVLYTNSQGVMIKRIQPSDKEGYIKCVSDNPKYAPFDVPMQDVVSLALVNGAITLE